MLSKYSEQIGLTMQILASKKNVSSVIIALLTLAVLSSCDQPSTEKAANHKRELAMPDFIIYTIEDSTAFDSKSLSKDGIILIQYFNPDCDHCQDEAKHYLSKKDSLQNIKSIWISGDWTQLKMMREFTENYQLEQLGPIAIGKELTNSLVSYYKFTGVPFSAVYKDDQLIKEYRGSIDFKELIAINNGTFIPEPMDSISQEEPNASKEKVKN